MDLGVSQEVADLSTAVYLIGFGLASPFVGPLSELGGRNPVCELEGVQRFSCPSIRYRTSLKTWCWLWDRSRYRHFAYILTLRDGSRVVSEHSDQGYSEVFCRIGRFYAAVKRCEWGHPSTDGRSAEANLTSFGVAVFLLCVKGGSLADIWSPLERTTAFPSMSFSPTFILRGVLRSSAKGNANVFILPVFANAGFLGPVLGPVIGGFIGQSYLVRVNHPALVARTLIVLGVYLDEGV